MRRRLTSSSVAGELTAPATVPDFAPQVNLVRPVSPGNSQIVRLPRGTWWPGKESYKKDSSLLDGASAHGSRARIKTRLS